MRNTKIEGQHILNALWVNFSEKSFPVEQTKRSHQDLGDLRDKHGESWFFYPKKEYVYALRRPGKPRGRFRGFESELDVESHLGLLASRFEEELPQVFPDQEVERERPFTLLGNKNLVQAVQEEERYPPHLSGLFDVRTRYELSTRLINPANKRAFVALLVGVLSRWKIPADLEELQKRGVNLEGLVVKKRETEPGESSLVGRVRSLQNGEVALGQRCENTPDVFPSDELCLEGSKENYAHCLRSLIGNKYERFEKQLRSKVSSRKKGRTLYGVYDQLAQTFVENGPVELAPGFKARVHDKPVPIRNEGRRTSVYRARPIEYCFNPSRTKRHEVPWFGLESYGPFSQDSFGYRSPRLLIVCPESVQGTTEQFLNSLFDGVSKKNSNYDAGLASTFGLVNPEYDICKVPSGNTPSESPGRAYGRAIQEHFQKLSSPPSQVYKAAIVAIKDEHADLAGKDSPYLQAKAKLLMSGVPTQQVKRSTMRAPDASLQHTLQNISVALYAKMGGVPWTVDQNKTISHELVIGLGVSEPRDSRFSKSKRLVGITTVFRGDGNYLLGNLSRECPYEEYPEVLRESTLQILKRQKREDGWQPGDNVRLVFHTTKRLQNIEVDQIVAECVEEVREEQNVEFAFLTISKNHPYTLLDLDQESNRKATYVPRRGTIAQVSWRQRLVMTIGAGQVRRPDMPALRPLLLKLHTRSSTYKDMNYLSEQVFKFTGLSWRTVRPIKMPVTIEYSKLIAEQLSGLSDLDYWSPETLDTQLRASRWFL